MFEEFTHRWSHLIIAMTLFSFSMSISPGPVNMVIVSSGANHGIRKTLPYISGATIGFTLLLVCVAFGFAQFANKFPLFFRTLGVAGAVFITCIGYRIASSTSEISLMRAKVPTFWEGFLLQWLNPKAWIACGSGVAMFSSPNVSSTLMISVGVYLFVCYACLVFWAWLGERVSKFLNSHARIRALNMLAGVLLMGLALYLGYLQVDDVMDFSTVSATMRTSSGRILDEMLGGQTA